MWAALLALLAGCTVGPDYERPDLEARLPAAWRTTPAEDGDGALAREDPALAWWRAFDDPALTRLVRKVVAENPSLAEARQRVVEARAARGEREGERGPQIDAEGRALHTATGETGLNFRGPPPGRETELFGAGAVAGWEIDLWGRVHRRVQAADREMEAAIAGYRSAAVSLTAEVARAFMAARAARARLEVLERRRRLAREAMALAGQRREAGTGTAADVERARGRLESAGARVPAAREALERARHRIAVLTGRPPRDGLLPAGELPKAPLPVGMGVPADLIARRPDVREAERHYAAAVARVGAAQALAYPRVTLSGRIDLQAQDAGAVVDASSLVYSLGPEVSFPLLDGGRIESRVRVRRARAERARFALERTLLEAVGEVESAAVALREASRELESRRRRTEAARREAALARERYEAGIDGREPVLEARLRAAEAREARIAAREALLASVVTLYRALGGGWRTLPERSEATDRETKPRTGSSS